jgi:signal transduction histidine kinase
LEQQVQLRTADMELILQELGQVNAQMESELNERKVLESQLVQAQKMESVGQLAAGVAHEINNPVGFILSNLRTLDEYVQLLQQLLNHYEDLETSVMQVPLGELGDNEALVRPTLENLATFRKNEDIGFILQDLTGLLAESIDGSNRVKEIVQGLKSFSRIDESTLQQVDLHECIESTLKVVWNEVKYKCNVIKHYDAELPQLLCYPGQLNQVFLNLLVNAAQAIEQRGDITITTRTDRVNELPHILIDIADTGSGIPPKLLTKIFDPFFTTKPVSSGSGLGLAISYGIVHKHQGTLTVQSTVGEGTTFTIALPLNALTPNDATEPSFNISGVPSHDRPLLSPVAA